MKRISYIPVLICLLCLVVFSGCKVSEEEYEYQLFYLNEDEDQLVAQGYNAQSGIAYDLVTELLTALTLKPAGKDVKTPGFDSVRVLNHSYISLEGYVTINFSAEYNLLPRVKETLCRAAIVKTLCQIEGINGVKFAVENEPFKNGKGEDVGYMTAETFVDSSSQKTSYRQTMNVSLYFASEAGNKLVKLPVSVTFDGTISLEQLVVQQLAKGPDAIEGAENVKAAISNAVTVNQVTVREQICYLDLSEEFITALPGIEREVALYSVVNSLVELSGINKVQISIDGDIHRYYGDSSIVFDAPLERNLEIVKE